MNLSKVKRIRQKDKDLVSGYIRTAQSSLNNMDNLCNNIPAIIGHLVALYLYVIEYFAHHGTDLNISDNGMTLTCTDNKEYDEKLSAYGYMLINNKTKWKECVWKFKMSIFDGTLNPDGGLVVNIGLVSSNCNGYLFKADRYYSFCVAWTINEGQINLYDNDNIEESTEYWMDLVNWPQDRAVHDQDEVILKLNLEKKILSLCVKGKQWFEYFNIEMGTDIEYKLGVTLDIGRGITLIDCKTY